jgi:hypothetical protein
MLTRIQAYVMMIARATTHGQLMTLTNGSLMTRPAAAYLNKECLKVTHIATNSARKTLMAFAMVALTAEIAGLAIL